MQCMMDMLLNWLGQHLLTLAIKLGVGAACPITCQSSCKLHACMTTRATGDPRSRRQHSTSDETPHPPAHGYSKVIMHGASRMRHLDRPQDAHCPAGDDVLEAKLLLATRRRRRRPRSISGSPPASQQERMKEYDAHRRQF